MGARYQVKYFFFAALVLALGLGSYAFLLEPFWLESTHHKVFSSTIHGSLKIAHVTDLHISKFGKLESKVLQSIQHEAPDVVILTGDIVDREENVGEGNAFLSKLSAPLGVYAVNGNWEHWSLNDEQIRKLAQASSVSYLNNRNIRVRKDIWLVGQDDFLSGRAEPGNAFAGVPDGVFCIGMFHSPEAFSQGGRCCDLNLAGHTHGGQVRLPFLGPLWVPPGSGEFVSGWYESGHSKLYVNRGVGTSILPVRFLSRPEIAFITIMESKK